MGILTAVWHPAIEILLPSRCVGCGTGGTYLCDGCIGRAPRAAAVGLDTAGDALDAVTAPLAFEGTARTAVHRPKYSGLRAIAPAMARPMAEALSSAITSADVVVPVPLHASRERQRGFNQALAVAPPVGEAVGLPVRGGPPRRAVARPPPVAPRGAADSRGEVRGGFGLAPGAGVAGLRIILVDDVLTTGSTPVAAASALKRGGARSVHAPAFARGRLGQDVE